jgi:hypothetical protein
LDHHQIRLVVEVQRFDVLILERHFVVFAEIPGERRQAERREQRVLDGAGVAGGGDRAIRPKAGNSRKGG